MTIGERIKQARHMRCLRQRELASRASVSAQVISKYERDQDVLIRLSKALEVGIEEKNSATAPRLIREAVEVGAIVPYDSKASKRYMKYVPWWASGQEGGR